MHKLLIMHNVKSLHSNGPHLEEIFHLYIFKGMKQMTFNNIICIILFVLFPNTCIIKSSTLIPPSVLSRVLRTLPPHGTQNGKHIHSPSLSAISHSIQGIQQQPLQPTHRKKTFGTRMKIRNSVIVYAEWSLTTVRHIHREVIFLLSSSKYIYNEYFTYITNYT